MNSSEEKDITLACYAMVSGVFASMHNTELRGANFKWEEFATMMGDHCNTHIFLYVNPCTDKMKEYARKCGLEIAANLVSQMGK